ncbi:MAG: hypothetical protein V4628_15990, partial [Pseudomonadota bacterium]
MKLTIVVLLSFLTLHPAIAQQVIPITNHDEHKATSTWGQPSFGFGTWAPTRAGECSTELHNSYSGVNPEDGYRYHMWHPARDPSGCSFGHDHGHDPSNSALEQRFGSIYFSKANQHGMLSGIQMVHTCTDQATDAIVRCEDNVGQKTLEGVREFTDSKTDVVQPCAARVQFHMGVHSIDAATNNLHGATYQIACDDGVYANFTVLAQIEAPGGFTNKCTGERVEMGPAWPFNSPKVVNPLTRGNSFGTRNIVESSCIEGKASHTISLQFHELWRVVMILNSPVPTIKSSSFTRPKIQITNPNSKAGQWNWYWNASNVTRYLDAETKQLKYSINTCNETTENGDFLVKSGPCVAHRAAQAKLGREIKWDDPESFARGDAFSMRLTGFHLSNGPDPKTKPEVWYTDKEGLNPSLTEFPDSLRWEGQPTEWYVNALGADARMVPFTGSIKVQMSAVTINTRENTDETLSYAAPGSGTSINPNGTHA